ncbi:MAG: hypothetical protein ACR2PL_14505, partial [Dehalococcoidia bacterium]
MLQKEQARGFAESWEQLERRHQELASDVEESWAETQQEWRQYCSAVDDVLDSFAQKNYATVKKWVDAT